MSKKEDTRKMVSIAENYRIRGACFVAAPMAVTTVTGMRLLMKMTQHTKLA